jgi:hypothetical protein
MATLHKAGQTGVAFGTSFILVISVSSHAGIFEMREDFIWNDRHCPMGAVREFDRKLHEAMLIGSSFLNWPTLLALDQHVRA